MLGSRPLVLGPQSDPLSLVPGPLVPAPCSLVRCLVKVFLAYVLKARCPEGNRSLSAPGRAKQKAYDGCQCAQTVPTMLRQEGYVHYTDQGCKSRFRDHPSILSADNLMYISMYTCVHINHYVYIRTYMYVQISLYIHV